MCSLTRRPSSSRRRSAGHFRVTDRSAFSGGKGPGGDTGYGKTALMRESVRKINTDFGRQVEAATGMRDDRIIPIAAGFSELNTMNRTGLYPVLFNAVVGMAIDAIAPLLRARELICTEIGEDTPAKVAAKLSETRLAVAPTSPALRPDLLQVFAEAPDEGASLPRQGLQCNTDPNWPQLPRLRHDRTRCRRRAQGLPDD